MALMMSELHGIDPNHVTMLRAAIENTDDLMKIWSNKTKRAGLVTSTGIAEEQFLKFASMPRLSRVNMRLQGQRGSIVGDGQRGGPK